MNQVRDCLAIINKSCSNFKPQIGLILGSGLGSFADQVEINTSINFDELPGFPDAGVGGHAGRLLLGRIGKTTVAVLQGRAHYYEHGKADIMAVAIQTLSALGCESLVLTNAAGSLMSEASPGSVMLITDHINMTGISPLFGAQGNQRFVDMVEAYNPLLNSKIRAAAHTNKITLHEGIYAWMSGPQFETPAEIQALKVLGAQAVGMSTVPEVILARHLGMPLCALSIITNFAAGMSPTLISHEQTIECAKEAENSVKDLLNSYLKSFSEKEIKKN
ncbi:MAG: purine-nucleoside phosphorylase [Gammaproteobacteria bacterium]|nr:purine-nucleoside phosphorylase [Gammaproteobacteria bacterium]